jgi:5'-methylthioadenosine phosphorylase
LDFVCVDQFVDRTNQARKMSFFCDGMVAHIMFAHPVCAQLSSVLYKAGAGLKLRMHSSGTYLNMEGPAFSTLAESQLYRQWGMDVIGMTNMPEAKLAREAEICYATLACVTDYDCWFAGHASVTVDMVVANLIKNVGNAKRILQAAIKHIPKHRSCGCKDALQHALITDKKRIPQKTKRDLAPIIGRYVR